MSFNASLLQIYVSCLASYNAGIAHGQWLDADTNIDTIKDQIAEMLFASTIADAEEWAIHDYNGFPDKAARLLGEHPSLEDVVRCAMAINDYGEVFEAALAGNDSIDEAIDAIEQYFGSGETEEEIIAELLEEQGTLEAIPDNLRPYFDYARYARDMRFAGEVYFERVNGTVYAFYVV